MLLKYHTHNNLMPKLIIGMMLADMFLKGMLYGMYLQKKL
jgi:hypothetical protein